MKRAFRLLVLCSSLAPAFLMIGVGALVVRNHASTQDSVKSTIISSSGQKLTTFYEGLPRSPKFALKGILAARRALPRCGKKQENAGINQRLFGSAVVSTQAVRSALIPSAEAWGGLRFRTFATRAVPVLVATIQLRTMGWTMMALRSRRSIADR